MVKRNMHATFVETMNPGCVRDFRLWSKRSMERTG